MVQVPARVRRASALRVTETYLYAKKDVVQAGYGPEIAWQESLSLSTITESAFLSECAWVILNAGMKASVIRGLWGEIGTAFRNWSSASNIVRQRQACVNEALVHFNHPGKIGAIADIAEAVQSEGFEHVIRSIMRGGLEFLRTLPYIGPVTSYHLAKNLGMDVAKPDRHLVRITNATGYSDPGELCHVIASSTGDRIAVVDLVLWRYATLHSDYLSLFQWESPDLGMKPPRIRNDKGDLEISEPLTYDLHCENQVERVS